MFQLKFLVKAERTAFLKKKQARKQLLKDEIHVVVFSWPGAKALP
jgi:hypothetical protein